MSSSQKTVLKIDTSKADKTVIWLGEKKFKALQAKSSQQLLPLIQSSLKSTGLDWHDLGSVEVFPGPGSFTGLRIGFAVANTLGWVLGIPVNGQTKPVEPEYEDKSCQSSPKTVE